MTKKIIRTIKKIAQDNEMDKIVIFTSHLKIEATLFFPEGKCEECMDDYMTLRDVQVCRISDYCACDDDDICECHDYICFRYDWFNLNINEIVAFSVVS